MADGSSSVLVINDGGLAALAACLMVERPESVTCWVPPPGSPLLGDRGAIDDHDRHVLIARQADVLGIGRLIERPAVLIEGAGPVVSGLRTGADLVLAALDAASIGCRTVVWPVVCGDDLDRLFEAAECAQLVTRLAGLDALAASFGAGRPPQPPRSPQGPPATAPAIRIETPFIDLTPDQVAEAADDLDAPRELCWLPRRTAAKA